METMEKTKQTKHLNSHKRNVDLGVLQYGKLPPQARELEEAVLGAIMLEAGAFDIVAEILKSECFYVEAHKEIFRACQSLFRQSMPIDMLTIVEELKKLDKLNEIGGPYFVTKLTNTVVSTANLESHARIVLQKFIQRELIRISGEIIAEAYEDSTDVFDLLDESETNIYNISSKHLKSDYAPLGSDASKFIEHVENLRSQENSITGVNSTFPELDKVTRGWQPTDLIILAARPSVGKTAFALNLAKNAVNNHNKQTPIGFFSLEMSRLQLLNRLACMISGLHVSKIQTGRLNDVDMQTFLKAMDEIYTMPFYVDDTGGINLFELRAKARRMIKKHQVGLIVIDYLQLMTGDEKRNSSREQEISSISRGLKRLAKDLNVPVIALSQLSREVEKRTQKVPQLSDLRESGAIEQDADVVMFLYRPAEDEIKQDAALANKAMLKIAKHRNGRLESFAFNVTDNTQQWIEKGVLNRNCAQVKSKTINSSTVQDDGDKMPF
jgi:replicative DNA helicase